MTNDEHALIDMALSGILLIESSGLVWKTQKKHKEWDGYRPCNPKLLGHNNSNGYSRIGVRDAEGVTRKAFAHRIVFMYFNGDIPEGLTVNHKNGEKQDNRLDNLELMTPVQQMRHAREVLGRKMGNFSHLPRHWKIPRDDISAIRDSSFSVKELAENYGVTTKRIEQILKGD